MGIARILIVCTANACRSPVAERLLARRLESFGVRAAVTSAGTDARGTPVHRYTAAAATERGVDLTDHHPRKLTGELLASDGHDLVVAMTRDHLYRIESISPGTIGRSFTLHELAGLARTHGVDPTTTTVAQWATTLAGSRSLDHLIGAGSELDISDPYGRPRRFHDEMIDEVDRLVSTVVQFLAPSVDPLA